MYLVCKFDARKRLVYMDRRGNFTRNAGRAWKWHNWHTASLVAEVAHAFITHAPQSARAGNAALPIMAGLVMLAVLTVSAVYSPLANAVGEFASADRWHERIAR